MTNHTDIVEITSLPADLRSACIEDHQGAVILVEETLSETERDAAIARERAALAYARRARRAYNARTGA